MSNGIINYLRTFNDCLVLLCIDRKVFEDETKHLSKQQLAEIKLKLIIKVLNNDWIPKLDGNEYMYSIWFKYNKETDSVGDRQGSFSYYYYDDWGTDSDVGFGWGFKTPELAKYCAEQFIDLWNDYLKYDTNDIIDRIKTKSFATNNLIKENILSEQLEELRNRVKELNENLNVEVTKKLQYEKELHELKEKQNYLKIVK